MPERVSSYGSSVSAQGPGPSLEDMARFNHPPTPSRPLRPFSNLGGLTIPTVAAISIPFVSGCISVTPAKTGEAQQSADSRVDFSGESWGADRFDTFFTDYDGRQTEIGVVEAWIDTLGIPRSAIDYYNTYDFLSNPTEATTAYFSIIPNDGIRPSKGDIAVIGPTSDYANGTLGIATGEQENFEGNLQERVFMHYDGNPNFVNTYKSEEIFAWLKLKPITSGEPDVADGQGDQGNDVLVARADSIEELYKAFFKKWDGEGVEANDPENFRQCMDLITAWTDALGIPRETVVGLELAKNLYLNPHKITRDFFEITPYEEGMEFQPGDIGVWGEKVGSAAGHVAISNGEKNKYFSANYPLEDDPDKRVAHLQEISNKGLIGRLRPKGFSAETATAKPIKPKPTESDIEVPYVPDTPEEFARYHLADQWIERYLITSRGLSDINTGEDKWRIVSGVKISEEEKERIKQNLAKGKEAKGPISFYYYSTDAQKTFREGDIYVVPIRVIIAELENVSLESEEYADNGRNSIFGDRASEGVFAGKFRFSTKIRFGVADLTIKASAETSQSLGLTYDMNPGFIGFDKITKFSSWQSGESELDAFAYSSGEIECYSPLLPRGGALALELCLNVGWDQNGQPLHQMGVLTQFGITEEDVQNSRGYNGEFVIKP